jgi:hypothetical protein
VRPGDHHRPLRSSPNKTGLALHPACVGGPNLPRQLGTGDRDLALEMESDRLTGLLH